MVFLAVKTFNLVPKSVPTKHLHVDRIKIRYDTIHIEFSISNFITIRYVSNFYTQF
jgi:hypothetical protein